MKSLEEKRDEACIEYVGFGYGCDGDTSADSFKAGWDACAEEYEKEIAELKKQLEIAKKALQEIKIKPHIAKLYNIEIYRCPTCDSAEIAAQALKDIESAGE